MRTFFAVWLSIMMLITVFILNSGCPIQEQYATTATRQYQSSMLWALWVAPILMGTITNLVPRHLFSKEPWLDRVGAYLAPAALSLILGLGVGITQTLP